VATDLNAGVAARLRAVDQRYTAGRQRLVELLERADRPLTVPEILELEPALAPSSAYRNLTVLVEAGVVARIVTSQEHAHFELDSSYTHHHHHLVCQVCGRVTDFTLGEAAEHDLDAALIRIATGAGYTGIDHRLDVVGTCPDCHDTQP